ncbi:hypothetical protein J6590_009879 [Homalodisca vitripennis]|nr:hypothetical protein J6590_009879 [Homalodisca vitripennis]
MSMTSRSVLPVANCVTRKAFKLTEPQYLSKRLRYVDDVLQRVFRGQLRDSQSFQTHGDPVPDKLVSGLPPGGTARYTRCRETYMHHQPAR